jgi:hypothetical protein
MRTNADGKDLQMINVAKSTADRYDDNEEISSDQRLAGVARAIFDLYLYVKFRQS